MIIRIRHTTSICSTINCIPSIAEPQVPSTMNLSFASLVLICISSLSAVSATGATFLPYRVDFVDLTDDDSFRSVRTSFMEALSHVGMVSVTNIPYTTSTSKLETILSLHKCSQESTATLTAHLRRWHCSPYHGYAYRSRWNARNSSFFYGM